MGVIGDVVGGLVGSKKSKKAAKAITQAADQNTALQTDIYNQNKGNLTGFMDRGNQAGATYNALLGLGGDKAAADNAFNTYRNSTGYQFRVGQGVDAISSNRALNGLLKSGSTLKAVNDYGQNMGSAEFGNYLGYLGNQQGTGLSAANALAGVGTQYAGAVSNNNNQAAGAKADNYINQANLFSNFLNQANKRASQAFGMASSY